MSASSTTSGTSAGRGISISSSRIAAISATLSGLAEAQTTCIGAHSARPSPVSSCRLLAAGGDGQQVVELDSARVSSTGSPSPGTP
ncbi:MAG: hypothetical protein R2705_08875 [Ilumatobacteraceae bacterium]